MNSQINQISLVVYFSLDIQPPKIVCPKDIDVTVAEPGDNSTIVHYDVQKPQAIDNSGLVYYRVLGVPNLANHAFPVGYTMLTYEAHDETGNKASCHQYVHVRGKNLHITPTVHCRKSLFRCGNVMHSLLKLDCLAVVSKL